MLAHPLHSSSPSPLVYADQRKKKVFVLANDRSHLIPPEALSIEDRDGNNLIVPIGIQGDMTVLDVKHLSAGRYLLKIVGLATQSIKFILF